MRVLEPLAVAFLATLACGSALAAPDEVNESARLAASDAIADDFVSESVSISGDTAILGAFLSDAGGNQRGSAYVFTRTNGVWSEQQKLTASDGGDSDGFGRSVLVRDDVAFVGAHAKTGSRFLSGTVYMFTRSEGAWTEVGQINSTNGANVARFGSSLAIDGDTLVVGAQQDDINIGAAYVFTGSGTTWTQQQKLTPPDGQSAGTFGNSVAVSGDVAVIGARNTGNGGAIYVYERSEGIWTFKQSFRGSQFFSLGYSVAIRGDRIFAGAPGSTAGARFSGSVLQYTREGGDWVRQTDVRSPEPVENGSFGRAVAFDGESLIVGALRETGAAALTGAAYSFGLNRAEWIDTGKFVVSDQSGEASIGGFVAQDAGTVLVSAGAATVNDVRTGAAYIFDRPPLPDGAKVLPDPSEGFLVLDLVKARTKRGKTKAAVRGRIDLGTSEPDLTQPVFVRVGNGETVQFENGLVERRKNRWRGVAGPLRVDVTLSARGSSLAKIKITHQDLSLEEEIRAAKDPAAAAFVRVSFESSTIDASASVRLAKGKFKAGAKNTQVFDPSLSLKKVVARLTEGTDDRLDLVLQRPPSKDGRAPDEVADLTTVCFGEFAADVTEETFDVRRRSTSIEFRAPKGTRTGLLSMKIDYRKGLVTVRARGVEVGDVAEGPQPLVFAFGENDDFIVFRVLVVRKGSSLRY